MLFDPVVEPQIFYFVWSVQFFLNLIIIKAREVVGLEVGPPLLFIPLEGGKLILHL